MPAGHLNRAGGLTVGDPRLTVRCVCVCGGGMRRALPDHRGPSRDPSPARLPPALTTAAPHRRALDTAARDCSRARPRLGQVR